MKPQVFLAATTAVFVLAAATPLALATPITYTLSDATATFGTSDTDTLSGTFTFDPATETLDTVAITLTGPAGPTGMYDTPISAGSTFIEAHITSSTIQAFLTLDFQDPLGPAPDALKEVQLNNTFSSAVTGSAVPAPEPSTLALLGGALGLFLLGTSTNRRDRRPPPSQPGAA